MKKIVLISTMLLSISSIMAMNSAPSTGGAGSVPGATTIIPGGIDGSSPGTRLDNNTNSTIRNNNGTINNRSRTRSNGTGTTLDSNSTINTQPSLDNQLDRTNQLRNDRRRQVRPGSGLQGDPMDPTQDPNSSTIPRAIPSTP